MRFKAADAGSKHVYAAATNDPSNRHPRQAELAHDCFDRRPRARQRENRVRSFLAALIAVPLLPLRACQNRGIERTRSQGLPDGPHMLAHHVEKGSARVLDEMPTIGDLDRLRGTLGGGFAIAGTSVAGDKIDPRMVPKPCDGGATLAIRKECHDMAPLKIADDGSIATPSSPCPIINPHSAKQRKRASGAAANDPQQRILADRDGEPLRETMPRPAAKGSPSR
jgi:hypothetical protein